MKKLILVMVFVLLTALFIAFNYLLWEREDREKELRNLEYANVSNNASISAQKREIDSLEEEIGSLEDEMKSLEKERERNLVEKQSLAAEKDKINENLQDRIKFINAITKYIDIKTLSEPLTKWVEAVNQGRYEDAYNLEYEGIKLQGRPVSLEKYTEEMKKTIRKIEIVEVKLDKLRGAGNGEIFLEAKLNVKLTEDSDTDSTLYKDGINNKYVNIGYSYEKNAFFILSIEDR